MRTLNIINTLFVLFILSQNLYRKQRFSPLPDTYMQTVREKASSPKAPEQNNYKQT